MTSDTCAKWSFYDPTSTSSHSVSPSKSTSGSGSSSTFDITINSGPKTDWWTTAPGSQPESSAHRCSGPTVYQSLKLAPDQDWKLSGNVVQQGNERFQQTTLFVKRINPDQGPSGEGQLWLKSGIENEGGRKYVGVVATNPYSDWNVSPLPSHTKASVFIEIEKVGPDMHVYYSYPATTDTHAENERFLLREKKGFALPQPTSNSTPQQQQQQRNEEWWIGAMVCGPLTESTEGTVQNWKFQLLHPNRPHQH